MSGTGSALLNDENIVEAIATNVVMSVAGSIGGKKLGEIYDKSRLRKKISDVASKKVSEVLYRKGVLSIKNIPNPENLPRSRHLQNFEYGKVEESTVGKLLDDEYFRKSGKLKDVEDIKVKIISKDEMRKFAKENKEVHGYYKHRVYPPVIYIANGLTVNEREYVLYHELYHIRQKRAVLSNPKYRKAFAEYSELSQKEFNLENELEYEYKKMTAPEIAEKINEWDNIQDLIDNHLIENNANKAALREYKNRRNYYGSR